MLVFEAESLNQLHSLLLLLRGGRFEGCNCKVWCFSSLPFFAFCNFFFLCVSEFGVNLVIVERRLE